MTHVTHIALLVDRVDAEDFRTNSWRLSENVLQSLEPLLHLELHLEIFADNISATVQLTQCLSVSSVSA